jgi:hypothetical protein
LLNTAFQELFPEATVFHLGLYRDKVSLEPVEYYCKLPSKTTADTIFILDPLIATGGTAVAGLVLSFAFQCYLPLTSLRSFSFSTAVNMILDWGVPMFVKLNPIIALSVK